MAKKKVKDNVEQALKDNPQIDFIPFDIKGDEEEDYLKSKAFFLENESDIEASLKKIERALDETRKVRDAFIVTLANCKEKQPNEDFTQLERMVENYNKTIEQFEEGLEKNQKALDRVLTIIEECFTETVADGIANVSENGKIFSKYFTLVLENNE